LTSPANEERRVRLAPAGAAMASLWRDSVSLFVFGCVILGIAISYLRKRLS
jgi:hypothetical protein